MKVAIMQPYFLPYLGYFSLIKHTDEFILLDAVQYMKGGWIERNRILKPGEGTQYINIPLQKHHMTTTIKDIKISNETDWRGKILRQLEHYKKRAPFYNDVLAVLREIFSLETDNIVTFNQHSLNVICNYIGIHADITVFTGENIEIETPAASDEWSLNICKALGNIQEYWNPVGGATFYDASKYHDAGIDIKFQEIDFLEYHQYRNEFEVGLSIVDVMMFNAPEEINEMLDHYHFVNQEEKRLNQA